MTDKQKLNIERKKVNTNPSEVQINANNYKKGHINLLGFNISIENPKGSYRCGKDKNGKEWKTLMKHDYGYFTRTLGYDGDAIDVFIGDNLKSIKIFAIDQFLSGKFDETKIMLGFNSKEEAKKGYLSCYEKNWKGFKTITEVDIDTFKKWLYDGHQQRKPFYKYVEIKANSINEQKKEKDKIIKNDEGNIVPKNCPDCGSEVLIYIQGEPIYRCSNDKCKKYFGVVPCHLHEKKIFLTESQVKYLKEQIDAEQMLMTSIENRDKYNNTPDAIYFFGNECGYRNKNFAKVIQPFSQCKLPMMEQELFFGEEFKSHNLIRNKIINEYFDNFSKEDLCEIFNIDSNDDYTINETIRNYIFDNELCGRYFIITNPFNGMDICIFSFWTKDYSNIETIDYNGLIKQVIEEKPKINDCYLILVANGKKPYQIYKGEDNLIDVEDNSEKKILHNLNASDKWKMTKDFRDEKEKLIGNKLAKRDINGKKNGQEMTMAQYNSLRYMAENTKKTHLN